MTKTTTAIITHGAEIPDLGRFFTYKGDLDIQGSASSRKTYAIGIGGNPNAAKDIKLNPHQLSLVGADSTSPPTPRQRARLDTEGLLVPELLSTKADLLCFTSSLVAYLLDRQEGEHNGTTYSLFPSHLWAETCLVKQASYHKTPKADRTNRQETIHENVDKILLTVANDGFRRFFMSNSVKDAAATNPRPMPEDNTTTSITTQPDITAQPATPGQPAPHVNIMAPEEGGHFLEEVEGTLQGLETYYRKNRHISTDALAIGFRVASGGNLTNTRCMARAEGNASRR